MELLKELSQELIKDFMDNANHFDGEKQHRVCYQLIFFSEIEEEFRQLNYLIENDGIKEEELSSQLGEKIKFFIIREIFSRPTFLRKSLSRKLKLKNLRVFT